MSEQIMDNIFERFEYKYLIDKEVKDELLNKYRDYLVDDPYGQSTIRNIYYDTKDYKLARLSLEKPMYKEKLRSRCYKNVSADEEVFLELKKKYKGIVYKRRISVPVAIIEGYYKDLCDLPDNDQISNEMRYFKKYYGQLEPKVYLNYDRTAYFGKEDSNLRITFDENIQWRDEKLSLKELPGGRDILPKGKVLMEVKSLNSLPLWIVRSLSEHKVYQTSFSKYGLVYQTIYQEKLKEKRKQTCLVKYSVPVSQPLQSAAF